MTQCVQIVYTVKPEVDLGQVKAAITEFVASIASHHPSHKYTSYHSAIEPRSFVHIGELVEDVVPDFQTQPFFKKFSRFLKESCIASPNVTVLTRVALANATERDV